MARFFWSGSRRGSIPVFLILELVCLFLIVRFNQDQGAIFQYSLGKAVGELHQARTNLSMYLGRGYYLDSMARVQARLLENCLSANDTRFFVEDSAGFARPRDSFLVVPARVINNSINHRNNYMTLDRGRLAGIEPGMGVIDGEKPVGIVRAVSDHYALVMSLLHQKSRLSVELKNQPYFGSLLWKDLRNPKLMYVEDIPRHALLTVGDTLQTTGFSDIFPAGMPVGSIDTFWVPAASDFYEVKIHLFPDIAGLRQVYVIKKFGMEEKRVLEEKRGYE